MSIEIPLRCRNTPFERLVKSLSEAEKEGLFKIDHIDTRFVEEEDYESPERLVCTVFIEPVYGPIKTKEIEDYKYEYGLTSFIDYDPKRDRFDVHLTGAVLKVRDIIVPLSIELVSQDVSSDIRNPTKIYFSTDMYDRYVIVSASLVNVKNERFVASAVRNFFKELKEAEEAQL